MSVRVVSPSIVHAWLPAGFFVIRTFQLDEESVASAATCIRGTESIVWLASPSAFLRCLDLRNVSTDKALNLEEHFLSSLFESEAFPHSDLVVSLDVGDLYTICSSARQSSESSEAKICDCIIEVFGTKGYAMVDTHNGAVKKSFRWSSAAAALAAIWTIRPGPLRDAIVPRGFTSPAVVTISATGVLRACSGYSYADVRTRAKWNEGRNDVLNMCQTPVLQMFDPGNRMMVVMGCFRAGVVLYCDKGGKLATSRFIMKGGRGRLNRYTVIVAEEEESSLVLEDLSSGHRASIRYVKEEGRLVIDLDYDRRFSTFRRDSQVDDHTAALRSLLQGIEDLGEREKSYEMDCKQTEELISSYNSAVLFVTEWREKNLSSTARDLIRDSCAVSVDVMNVGRSTRLPLPDPLLGRELYITASFKNSTGITLGEGWMLRLCIQKEAPSKIHEGSPTRDTRETKVDDAKGLASRVMTCPVEKVAPGEARSVSFPFIIDTHAPLAVSVALCFHHPAIFVLVDSPVDIEVTLRDNVVLDILDLSKSTRNKELKDSSHEHLASSQLMQLFNDKLAEKQRGYPLVSRFDIPFAAEDARTVFGFAEPSTSLESFLGAQYTLSIGPISLRGEAQGEHISASTVTMRGVPHVLPFIRAALLRRLLKALAQNEIGLKSKVVRNRGNIERWQRSLVDAADDCLPSFRRAESRLVEALRMYDEIERGSIEHCTDGQEREAMVATLQNAKATYGMWRRKNERLWTPKGAVDAKK